MRKIPSIEGYLRTEYTWSFLMKRIVFIVSLMLVGFVIWPYGELRYGTLIDDHPSFYVVTWACRLFMVGLLAWLTTHLNRKISA